MKSAINAAEKNRTLPPDVNEVACFGSSLPRFEIVALHARAHCGEKRRPAVTGCQSQKVDAPWSAAFTPH
jgi:hypothetical protein